MVMSIGLAGYFGWGNYGDELFCEILRSTFDDCRTVNLIDHTTGIMREDIEGIIGDIDAVIIGGGDLLIPWGLTPYFDQVLLKKPVYIIGIGVPLWGDANSSAINSYGAFLRNNNVRCVICRDEESSEWVMKTFDVRAAVAPDLVLAANFPPFAKIRNRIGFIVRDQNNISMENVANLGKHIESLGYDLYPIILGTKTTLSDDIGSYAKVLGSTRPYICNDIDAITNAIGSCDFVVSMKFHGIVAAYAMKTPFMALSGATKFTSFCNYTNNRSAHIPFDRPMEMKFDSLIAGFFDFSRLESLRHQSSSALNTLRALVSSGN